MIPKTHLKALQIIHERLWKEYMAWAVTGSTNMALQGMMVTPDDIDIQANLEDAYKIGELLSEYVVEPVAFKESDRIKSHYGKLEIEGVQVEIMGAVQKKLEDGNWEEPVNVRDYRLTVVYINLKMPVLDLEYERDAYKILGREEKVKILDRYLGY
jgi:hypothetical protein